MDRDGFWEKARDLGFMVVKIFAVIFILQALLIAFNTKFQFPIFFELVERTLGWYHFYVH